MREGAARLRKVAIEAFARSRGWAPTIRRLQGAALSSDGRCLRRFYPVEDPVFCVCLCAKV